MRRFWRREDRAEWPEPRPEFLQSLSDEIRHTRGRVRTGGLRLAFVVVLALAILVPSAFAAGSGTSGVRDAVRTVVSAVQADSKASPSRNSRRQNNDNDDNGNGNGNDDDDDNGDEDDYDKDCPNRHEQMRALISHQQQERAQLRLHQQQPHPGLSGQALRRHFKAERRALREHQEDEWKQFRRECRQRNHGDEDDN